MPGAPAPTPPNRTAVRSRRSRVPSGRSSSTPYAARLARLRAALRAAGYDGLVVSNPNDIRYLTPFSGEASCAVVSQRKLVIISDSRFKEELEALAPAFGFDLVIRRGDMHGALGGVLADLRLRTAAVQAEHMTVDMKARLARSCGKCRLKDSVGLLAELRAIKDAEELAAIRRAIRIQESALLAVLESLRPGQKESEVAARLEFEMVLRGASGPSFPTIVAAGANGSLPHARPGTRRTARGRTLLIDWGARIDGYASDMTRTFALGKWPGKLREAYGVVLEAFSAAVAAVRPGLTCEQLDGIARSSITKAGFGDAFAHSLGHGIGLDVHEAPRVAKGSRAALRAGMVITIEPGVYLPGIGGVRIEDDILVTDSGGRSLCSLPKDIDWATL